MKTVDEVRNAIALGSILLDHFDHCDEKFVFVMTNYFLGMSRHIASAVDEIESGESEKAIPLLTYLSDENRSMAEAILSSRLRGDDVAGMVMN